MSDFAFPSPESAAGNEEFGMTLRDYFAAKAMQGLLAGPSLGNTVRGAATETPKASVIEVVADVAYKVADAMLAAREKEGA